MSRFVLNMLLPDCLLSRGNPHGADIIAGSRLEQCVQALYTILEDTEMNGENIIVSADEGVFVDEATATYRDLQ